MFFRILTLLICLCPAIVYSQVKVAMVISDTLFQKQTIAACINDIDSLLDKAGVSLDINPSSVEYDVEIVVKLLPAVVHISKDYDVLQTDPGEFRWNGKSAEETYTMSLYASSPKGVANGLYALLQDKLGFSFYHTREMIIPQIAEWPLVENFEWKAEPRFNKMGFHIHSMHPLELTQPLLDHTYPNGEKIIKEYIDWLARNGQNYWEFNLLESIDLKRWPAYAKRFVDYSHSRGIMAGLDLSIHMIQQKAFMLYRSFPASFRNKKAQVKRNVDILSEARWDVWNVEFSSTEFTEGNVKQKQELQIFLNQLLAEKGIKMMGRKHVVKEDEMLGGAKEELVMTPEQEEIDKNRGIMIHTVMFYTLQDEKAPVYRNPNLRHMYDLMLEEREKRETWYYPESAYWVTFDISVPMLLLSYLPARLEDILLCDSLDLEGHLTFSSGWEWGYWLIDWSIARWSWKHSENEQQMDPMPLQFLNQMPLDTNALQYFANALELQEKYIKDDELIRVMVAQTVTDELPGPLNIEFHPRPLWSYKYISKEADMEVLKQVEEKYLFPLDTFTAKLAALEKQWETTVANKEHPVLMELHDALYITYLRAEHRYETLKYLVERRKVRLSVHDGPYKQHLQVAENLRAEALDIVKNREANYRYSLYWTARWGNNHTSYPFGYLYPVSNLHFWKREESQARKDRWGPLYMKIWNMAKNIGLIN